MDCELFAELGPALALDALDEPERAVLEEHARRCPTCARELRAWREVAAQLALAAPQREPPASLGARILAQAHADLASSTSTPPRGWWQRLQRWSPAVAAAALATAIAALVWGATLQAQLAETRQQLEWARTSYWTIARVLASPEAEVYELQPTEAAPGAVGKVWVDPVSGQGMMMARNLPPPPPGRTYQVWLVNDGQRVSSGFLRANEEGIYYTVLQAPGRLTDYQRIGVTLEPAGGSSGPTGPRVIGGEL